MLFTRAAIKPSIKKYFTPLYFYLPRKNSEVSVPKQNYD